eukprot:1151360-Pelagomonas_calceolata.AAC.1
MRNMRSPIAIALRCVSCAEMQSNDSEISNEDVFQYLWQETSRLSSQTILLKAETQSSVTDGLGLYANPLWLGGTDSCDNTICLSVSAQLPLQADTAMLPRLTLPLGRWPLGGARKKDSRHSIWHTIHFLGKLFGLTFSASATYAQRKGLVMNAAKSEIMHFNPRGDNVPAFTLGGA